jgi:class 3 adenylate cyclase/CHASE2 domain-containing sensor protein
MPRFSVPECLTWLYNRMIPVLLGGLALFGLWYGGQRAEWFAYNRLVLWSAKPVSHSPVVLVLIDDESIARLRDRFGPPPWSRQTYLAIFNRIQAAHPVLMVFDSHFTSVDRQGDARFFTALKAFPNLISGLVMEEAGMTDGRLNTHLPQYYRLNLGVVSVSEDSDGIIRSVKPVYQVHTGLAQSGIFPSLSLAAAYEYLNQTQPGASWAVDTRRDGGASSLLLYSEAHPEHRLWMPLNAENAFYLRWYRIMNQAPGEYARSHEAIPLWRFFESSQPLPSLSGRIALIGSSSAFYRDYHQTPMATRHLGPDIHATAIDNILQGQSIHKAGLLLNLSLLVFLCLWVFFLRFSVRSFQKTALYTVGTMILCCWLALWLLMQAALWLDVVTPELFIVVSFLVASTYRIFFKEKQLAAMERNLSQLVDPEVFQEIRRRAHVLKPGGQKLEITSLFVDIRNFTALAERLQPAEVTELLNAFYTAIVSIVFSYHGTVDKFMGDGILIIFGAPLPSDSHRAMALQAAQDILAATEQLCRHWQESIGIQTEIGISLNSGPAFVGFLGPADKLEYTAVGDTVNICVRLQEHTKQFHTRLVISEHTLTGTAPIDNLTTQYVALGEVSVRGREATIRIFTLPHAFVEHPA